MPVDNSLYRMARRGVKDAREEAFQENTGLIWSCAKRFLGLLEKDDLYQLGSIGLIKAIDGFDPDYGVAFSTYAVPHILGEMRRYLRDNTPVKISRSYKELAMQSRRAAADIKAKTGQEATVDQLSQAMGVEPDRLLEALDATSPPVYFEDLPPWSKETAANVSHSNDQSTQSLDIQEALSQLNPQERTVVQGRFFHGKTQVELAQELGVSQAQVSRMEKRALLYLRGFLEPG